MRNIVLGCYLFILMVILIAIGYSSHHMFDLAGDSLRYSYGKTGWEYAVFNYEKGSGRWAQGLTNDYRLYSIRGFMAALSAAIFMFGAFTLFKSILKNKLESLVLTLVFFLAVSFSAVRFYDFAFNMCMVMSYTIGMGMMLYSLPGIGANFKEFNWRRTAWICTMALVLPGLLEIFGVLFVFFLLAYGIYDFAQTRKVKVWGVIMVALTVASNLFTYYSPGNIRRRQRNQTDEAFNTEVLFDIWGTTWEKLFIPVTIFFLLTLVVITLNHQKNLSKFRMKGVHIGSLFVALLVSVLPLILIVFAVGEKAPAFKRVMNVSTVFTILLLAWVVYLIIRSLNRSIPLNKTVYHILLLAILGIGVGIYKSGTSFEAHKVYDQIASGDLVKYKAQEMARRDFLLADTTSVPKKAPALDQRNYKGTVIGVGNEHRRKPGFTMHHVYNDLFNQGKKVEITKEYPDPRVFASIYFFNQGNKNIAELVQQTSKIRVYYVSKYNCLLLQVEDGVLPSTVVVNGSDDNQRISITKELSDFENYYQNHPGLVGVILNPPPSDIETLGDAINFEW